MGRRRASRAAVVAIPAILIAAVVRDARAARIPETPSVAAPVVRVADAGMRMATIDDSLAGKSGKLRARILGPKRGGGIKVLERLFGDSAARHPGVYEANDSASGRPFSFITLVPFDARERGRLGDYRIGRWPGERSESFEEKAPEGFIEVTSSNQDTQLSENFRLRDFLTHDQQDVWPKYLVVREPLVDKLELLIQDLRSRGVRLSRLSVMSGFRTPQYNAQGVGRKGGRAKDSRHQYGDAADVFVDNDGDGRMDDLNRDGRVDTRDAKFLLQSVERIEEEHPELVGGAGLYRATRAHGPFVHVDVRGKRARWGRG